MLLEKLVEYYNFRMPDHTPKMYQKEPIKWLIDLDVNGKFRGFVTTTGQDGKRNDRGKKYPAPHLGKASGIMAKLLADNGEYVLGIPNKSRTEKQKKKVPLRHNAFLEQVKECAEATHEPDVEAVLYFLKNLDVEKLPLPEDFDPGMNLTFQVEGKMPMDLPAVRDFWAQKASGGSESMQCLICGKESPPAKRLAYKFKRKHIPNGQQSGMALISANLPAFESYGRKASLIAPTCKDCGEKFSKAAFSLIEEENTSIAVGPIRYIFWTTKESKFNFASILTRPEPAEVKLLLESAIQGKRAAVETDITPFYAAALSASGGRVVVRDWLETTLASAKSNLARWFRAQQIVGEWGETDLRPLPIRGYLHNDTQKRWVEGLAECIVPKVRNRRDIKDVNPNAPRTLLRWALYGGELPSWLMYEAVKRDHAEQDVVRARAALIKMVLLSKQSDLREEDKMVSLDLQERNAGYLCGRLLAVLEYLQFKAQGKTGSTVVSRFYGAASSAPATVFGPLLRGAQNHLDKLRKTNEPAYHGLQQSLEEVQREIKTFPKTLTLEEQGLFALGYYHQRAEDRAAARAHKQEKEGKE